jgi:hypothetical protein
LPELKSLIPFEAVAIASLENFCEFRGVCLLAPRLKIAQRFAGGKAASGETVKMPRRPHKTGGLV